MSPSSPSTRPLTSLDHLTLRNHKSLRRMTPVPIARKKPVAPTPRRARKAWQRKVSAPKVNPKDPNKPPMRRRKNASMNALKDIRHFQRTIELLIPRLPFARLARKCANSYLGQGIRFKAAALQDIQELAESQLTTWFECLNHLAVHGGRVTIQKKDADCFGRLRHTGQSLTQNFAMPSVADALSCYAGRS